MAIGFDREPEIAKTLLHYRIETIDGARSKADLMKGGKEWAGLIYIGGTHPASAGGAWIAAVNGFVGIKERDGELECESSLPDRWIGMSFKFMFRSRLYMIEIKDGSTVVTVL